MILAKSVIKDKFWILEENAKRVGMMNFKDNNYTINLKRKDLVAHDEDELKNMGIEFVVRDLTHGGHLEVMGYPTDQEEVFNVKEIDGFPTFTKKAASKSTHVAGWYGLKFKNGWCASLCPRLSTVKTNTYVGPFKTKMDLKVVLGQQKDAILDEDDS
jgi:hypothetical protein